MPQISRSAFSRKHLSAAHERRALVIFASVRRTGLLDDNPAA
jgi:hypothetical protein